jgi:hypothetical protein
MTRVAKSDLVEVPMESVGLMSYEDFMGRTDVVDLNDIAPSAVLDKESLIGVPFVCLEWTFREGSYGPNSEFVAVQVLCADNTRGVLVDGSTGVKDQLKLISERMLSTGGLRPLACRGGLYKSEYTNEYGPGATFYLASADKAVTK